MKSHRKQCTRATSKTDSKATQKIVALRFGLSFALIIIQLFSFWHSRDANARAFSLEVVTAGLDFTPRSVHARKVGEIIGGEK